jgi:hypothetical protein
VADKIDELDGKTGEDIPVNTLTPDTSVNSAINACFGRTGSDIPVSTGETETIAEAINAFNAKRITPTVSNVHTGMTVDASYRDVFDLGGFYYIAIKINITTAIGTWQNLFDIAEISTTQAVRFFAQHQTTTDKAICYCLNNSIQSQTALSTGDWWLIAVVPKI